MYRLLLLLLIIVPALEIGIFILSSKYIGVLPTILFIIITGIVGIWLAKKEGLNTIRITQMQLSQGQIPSGVLLDGICIFIGAILLLAPGFLTDFVGLFFLIPQTRGVIKALLIKVFQKFVSRGSIIYYTRR